MHYFPHVSAARSSLTITDLSLTDVHLQCILVITVPSIPKRACVPLLLSLSVYYVCVCSYTNASVILLLLLIGLPLFLFYFLIEVFVLLFLVVINSCHSIPYYRDYAKGFPATFSQE